VKIPYQLVVVGCGAKAAAVLVAPIERSRALKNRKSCGQIRNDEIKPEYHSRPFRRNELSGKHASEPLNSITADGQKATLE
jgi:hypothetical protein